MNIKHKRIERVRITGKKEELDKAFSYVNRHGYRVTSCGPKRINAVRVDVTRIAITAEREASDDRR